MADFVSAEITQEIIDAKNKLNQQADRATLIVDGWEQAGAGMTESMYDPQGIQADVFKRSNMTGEQAISTITGLEVALDSKTSEDDFKTINGISIVGSGDIVIEGGGGGVAGVTSVNGESGTVVLDADNIDETASRIYFTPTEKTKLAGIETNANNYTLPSDVVQDANYVATENSYTDAEKAKLSGIEAGAEVNEVSSSDLTNGLATKQETLNSGTNIKTINGESLLGSGDITITGGGGGATAPTTIAITDLASTAAIAALGAGSYIIEYSGVWTKAELPFAHLSRTFKQTYTIKITDLGAGSWELEAVGHNRGAYGKFVKIVTPLCDSSVTCWSVVGDTVHSSNKPPASRANLTSLTSIRTALLSGWLVAGRVTYTGSFTGGAGSAYSTLLLDPVREWSDGAYNSFNLTLFSNNFTVAPNKKRYLNLDPFDSGWIDA